MTLTYLLLIPPAMAAVILLAVLYRNRRRRVGDGRPGGAAVAVWPPPPPEGMRAQQEQNARAAFPADPGDGAAVAAARAGDWAPAAALLAAAGRDWDRRAAAVAVLGEAAGADDDWLRAWQRARPDDPDAAVVAAEGLVRLAWLLRGGRQAEQTEPEQFEAFRRVLGQARDGCHRAAALAGPGDPTPYAVELSVALGLGYSHEVTRALFAEVTARAPHHQTAHSTALQFWCLKWHGSADLAYEFARDAAASAPPGTLFSRFPLVSWFEHHPYHQPSPDDRSPVLTALVDAGLADAAAAPRDSAQLRALRHVLAYYLYRQGRHAEAVEQFRMVDGHIGALPWSYSGTPARLYTTIRDSAFRGVSLVDARR